MNHKLKSRKQPSLLTRTILIALLAAGLFTILRPARNHIRLEYQTKHTLLTLQEALQKFHVEDEAYPKKSPMSGTELIQFLMEERHLKSPPLNPATLKPYSLDDNEPDRIIYTTDELAETYSLKALKPDSDDTFFIVDSTEHHSLE
ncbi:MAG: hypothetical protein GXP30_10330 [Verrucomicrobia bacterium]|nr:hypothetical protein [Verrucomicrobiota bacterium]